MRILRLRFKNLNSLVGEWDIDFSHPDYAASGIFAITGPTGAGKTTILDAICLALYGQTPRLSRISQSENEIMSRQTGDCFAEVEFTSVKGSFRCHWGQHRARRHASGALQLPHHEIAEAESGIILEAKLKGVAAKVEEVTGMDFDRFTRSMLLAQGGFAAFLQARPDERAPILEQITGTEIYSQISIKVHERTAEERKKLGELRAEIEGIKYLTPDEEALLQAEILTVQGEEAPLLARVTTMRTAQGWLELMLRLETEIRQLDDDWLVFTAAKEAAMPDIARLQRANQALTLAGDYAHIKAQRQQQQGEKEERQGLTSQLPQLQQECEVVVTHLAQADTRLKEAAEEQTREGELIQKVRELDVKLAEAAIQLKALTDDINSWKDQCDAHQRAIKHCDERLAEADVDLRKASAFLEAHQIDGRLNEELTGIEQQLKALMENDRQYHDTLGKQGRQQVVVKDAQGSFQDATTVFAGASQAVAEAEALLHTAVSAREALLQGREPGSWRQEGEKLAARHTRLQGLDALLIKTSETQKRYDETQGKRQALALKLQSLTEQEKDLTATLNLHEALVHSHRERVILLGRVRDLESERELLVDGAPCPLCGAVKHPYASGNIPPRDEAQEDLERAETELRQVRMSFSALTSEMIGVKKDWEQACVLHEELQASLADDLSFCGTESAALGIILENTPLIDPLMAETQRKQVATEIELTATALAGLQSQIQQVEDKEREERQAQKAFTELKEKLAHHDKIRLSAELHHQNAINELERIDGELEARGRSCELARTEIERALAPYGITKLIPAQAGQMMSGLLTRRSLYNQHLQDHERLLKGMADSKSEKEKQQALLVAVEKSLAEKSLQLREKIGKKDELVGMRQALYGVRNPDLEEKKLAANLRQASDQREKILGEHNRLHGELKGREQQILKLTSSIGVRATQLSELEPPFAQRLTMASFTDEADFIQACLQPTEYEGLKLKAERLQRDETELLARREDRRAALLREQEKKLTDQTLEQVAEESALLARQLSELQQGLGALQQRLQHHLEQQQRHQARFQEIEKQRQETARWERLHLLIGSSDGKKFRNFAQGLTFELMVAHANRQLEKMSDRYILVRDEKEPLELNVIDNYQAGEIRSTKNLSGGESFIASLALSLGLSSMASRNVRVDSLFLDEGFGTLDEDALETALATLSGLQQDGKLIGIISHVPALKERISTQIIVETGSGGCSRLQGPGCRGKITN